jgi:hypothetical protein
MEANFWRGVWGPLNANTDSGPRGSKPPGSSSRVVDTLETSLEHFVSLVYSAERILKYIWIKQLALRISSKVLIYHFE